MKSNASLLYNCFLVVGDFLSLLLAFVIAYILRVSIGHTRLAVPIHAITYLEAFLALLPFWILIFGLIGLYNNGIYEKRFAEMGRLFIGSFFGILFILGYSYAFNKPIFPAHLVALYGIVFSFILLVLFRNSARYVRHVLFSYNIGITNTLIVGDTESTHELVEGLHNYKVSGYRVVGIVGPRTHKKDLFSSIPVFKSFEDAVKSIGAERIHSIIQTELYPEEERNREIIDFAQSNHTSYRFTPGNSELFVGNIEVELFRSSMPVITVHQTQLFGWGRVIKRISDLVFGFILLVIAIPFMIIVALLILVFGGPGGIILKQTRLTRFDHKFNVLKFRTMKKAYSGMSPEAGFTKMGRPELIKQYRDNGDFLENDPRVTKIGRFLRAASLDELPQLINILKGDLSLVGPRALVPEELSNYGKKHSILSVKSGVTGLAQVSGRKEIGFEERRQLDIYYVQHWSFWLDLTILMKTLRVVLKRSGAK